MSNKSNYKYSSRFLATGIKLLVLIASTELLIMLSFSAIGIDKWMSPLMISITDTLVLSIFGGLMIFYWIVRPMKSLEEFNLVEKGLREAEKKYRRLFETSKDGIMISDLNKGEILDVNPSLIKLLGYPAEDYLGKQISEIDHFKDFETAGITLKKLQEKNYVHCEGISLKRADGRPIVIELVCNAYETDLQWVIQFNFRDITDRKEAEDELIERAHHASLSAEIGKALIQGKNLRSTLQLCSESIVKHLGAAFARIWILNKKENVLELQASAGMYTHIDGGHARIPVGKFKIGLIAQEKKPHLTNEVIGDPRISDHKWALREGMIAFAGHPLIVADRLVGVMAMFSKKRLAETALTALASISDEIALGIERDKSEEQIHLLAYYDNLTSLPNRFYFRELLKRKIEYANRYKKPFAIAHIDLDDFNRVNDVFGYDFGDKFLKSVSSRLLNIVRISDIIARIHDGEEVVARMGGDEFVFLMHELDEVEKTDRVARRILTELSQPFELDGHEIFITACMGISAYPQDGEDIEYLLKNADTALRNAKNKGKNQYQFYSRSMNETARELLILENNLRRAIERKELLIYYQPKMNLSTREIIGMEALIRWKQPEGNFISPAKFIPLAEKSGLIVPISAFVLQTACLQNKRWQEAGFKKMSVSVNISALQFGQRNFVKDFLIAVKNTEFDPHYLELEITETAIMNNAEKAIRDLIKLKEVGIRISVDDFGTGYSSLSYLRKLPLDILKIDISFIRNVVSDSNDAEIVKTIIAMAHSLKLKVIAEGVEDEQQLAFLKKHGCDAMQGYLLSPPVPAEEFSNFLSIKSGR